MDEITLTPIYRIEHFLDAIVNSTDCPYEARDRIELFLERIAGADIVTPEPMYRIEFYLAKIAGDDVEIPAPQHRAEFYLAAICGEDVELPDPHDRIDYWLYNWAEGSSLPWQTFVGNPVQFNAPKAHVLKSVKVEFSPKQEGSGDPSPDNVRPISGWTALDVVRAGENLCSISQANESYKGGATLYTMEYGANNSATMRTSTTGSLSITWGIFRVTQTMVGTVIYFSGDKTGASLQLVKSDAKDGTWPNSGTGVINSGSYTLRDDDVGRCYGVRLYNSTGETQTISNIMVNIGSTASPYSPYTGETTTITWQDEAGTVYGGYLLFNEDGSVDLVGTMADVDLGTLNWKLQNPWGTTPTFYAQLTMKWISASDPATLVCEQYKPVSANEMYLGAKYAVCNNGGIVVRINDERYTDAATFKTAMSGVMLCYELATPVIYHLPSLAEAIQCFKGINTIWSDANGDVTVEARAEAVNLNALQSLNMLLGGRYYNNGTADEPTDEEALDILLGGNER